MNKQKCWDTNERTSYSLCQKKKSLDDVPSSELVSSCESAQGQEVQKTSATKLFSSLTQTTSFSAPQLPAYRMGDTTCSASITLLKWISGHSSSSETTCAQGITTTPQCWGVLLFNQGMGCSGAAVSAKPLSSLVSLRVSQTPWEKVRQGLLDTMGMSKAAMRLMLFSPKQCSIPCDPADCSPPGSCVHGTLQARTLQWAAVPSCGASSRPGDGTRSPVSLQADSWPLSHLPHSQTRVSCLMVFSPLANSAVWPSSEEGWGKNNRDVFILRRPNDGANILNWWLRGNKSLCRPEGWGLRAWTTYLDFRELHNFREDFNAVGVSSHRMHASAVHDGCRDGLQFIPTKVNLFKLLQFCHFTKERENPRWTSHKISRRKFKEKILIIDHENQRLI